MTPEADGTQTYDPMAVVEKYETVIRYLYPIAQNLPRHKLLRKASVTSAKRKIERYTWHGDTEALTKFIASWRGHLQFIQPPESKP